MSNFLQVLLFSTRTAIEAASRYEFFIRFNILHLHINSHISLFHVYSQGNKAQNPCLLNW